MPDLTEIVHSLRNSRFHELSGARATATVPVAEGLLNRLIAATLPPKAPVRAVTVHPEDGDRLSVRIIAKAALIPPLTLKLAIDSQPSLPASPVLGLRMVTLGGLFGLASGAIAGMLPPGVTLDGDRILVNLGALAGQQGHADVLDYLEHLEIHTAGGRVVVRVEAAVR